MSAQAIVLPTERPPTTLDLKRALLSFERVFLPSPADRELIPPNWFQTVATGMPPMFGLSSGPVRPLGKMPDYDKDFEQLLDSANVAISEGLIQIRPAPAYSTGMTIGAIPIPSGLPHPNQVYSLYRLLTSAPEIVGAVSQGISFGGESAEDTMEALAPPGADDSQTQLFIDGQAVDSPHVERSVYPGALPSESLRPACSRLCYARIGALTKWMLIADQEQLTPYTTDIGVAAGLQLLDRGMSASLERLTSEQADREVLRRLAWLEEIAIAEFIDTTTLDGLSFKEVLKLRTKAWGKEGEARAKLFGAMKSVVEAAKTHDEFVEACKKELGTYLSAREEVDLERKKLILSVSADVGMGVTKVGGLAAAAEMLQKLFAAGSPELALVLGAIHYMLRIVKDYGPGVAEYVTKRKAIQDSRAYALFDPFRRMG